MIKPALVPGISVCILSKMQILLKTRVFSFLNFFVVVYPAEISAFSPALDSTSFSGWRVEASGFLRSQHWALS